MFLESNTEGRQKLLGIVHEMKLNLEGVVGVMLVYQQTKRKALQFESTLLSAVPHERKENSPWGKDVREIIPYSHSSLLWEQAEKPFPNTLYACRSGNRGHTVLARHKPQRKKEFNQRKLLSPKSTQYGITYTNTNCHNLCLCHTSLTLLKITWCASQCL